MHAVDYEEDRVQVLKYELIWCVKNTGKEKNLKLHFNERTFTEFKNNPEENWKVVLGQEVLTCEKWKPKEEFSKWKKTVSEEKENNKLIAH